MSPTNRSDLVSVLIGGFCLVCTRYYFTRVCIPLIRDRGNVCVTDRARGVS